MNKLYSLIFLFAFHGTCLAQSTFVRSYGNQGDCYGNSIIKTYDDNIILGGTTLANHDSDAIIIKVTMLGDTLWSKVFHYPLNESLVNMVQTSDSGIALLISSKKPNSYQEYYTMLVKLDSAGSLKWIQTFDTITPTHFIQTLDKGFCIIGNGLVNLIRTNDQGDTLWTRHIASPSIYWLEYHHVIQNEDSSFTIAAIQINLDVGGGNLVNVDKNGDALFKSYIGPGRAEYTYITACKTADSHYFVAGNSWNYGFFVRLTKVNPIYEPEWSTGFSDTIGTACLITTSSNDLLLLESGNINKQAGMQIQLLDTSGAILKSIFFKNIWAKRGNGIIEINNNIIAACATMFDSVDNANKIIFLKTNLNEYSCYGNYTLTPWTNTPSGYFKDSAFIISSGIPERQVSISTTSGITTKTLCASFTNIHDDHWDELGFKIYPNPTTDKVEIKVGANNSKEIVLYDITSRILLVREFRNETTLDMYLLPPGIYLYEIRNETGILKFGKVVKE